MISLEPSRFRSPLLRALPGSSPDRDPQSLRHRRAFIALAVVLVAAPAAVVKLRLLPPRGPVYFLYRIHDDVYLPAKGYLFTWLHPGSWIYLLTAASLLLFALVALAWKRPLTPAWHAMASHRLLARPRARGVLGRWIRVFKKTRAWVEAAMQRVEKWPLVRRMRPLSKRWTAWTGGPTFLEEVVEHDLEAALEQWDTLEPSSDAALRGLAPAAELTFFSAAVGAPLEPPEAGELPPEVLSSVRRLNQVLLRLDLARALGHRGRAAALAELGARLEAEILRSLRGALPRWWVDPDFSLPALVTDLALVLGLSGPPNWPKADGESAVTLEENRRRVLQGVETRRRQLDESRLLLERWSAYDHRRRRRTQLSELAAPADPAAADLAVDVALFAALRYNVPRSALAFLESLEGLRFALMMTGPPDAVLGDRSFDPQAHLAALRQVPRTLDYRICGCLLEHWRTSGKDLDEAVRRRSEVVSGTDLRLITARHEQLFVAAADPRSGS